MVRAKPNGWPNVWYSEQVASHHGFMAICLTNLQSCMHDEKSVVLLFGMGTEKVSLLIKLSYSWCGSFQHNAGWQLINVTSSAKTGLIAYFETTKNNGFKHLVPLELPIGWSCKYQLFIHFTLVFLPLRAFTVQ